MKTIGKLFCGILIGTWYVFVAWRLWGWFAVPLGAPILTFVHAFGLYSIAASVILRGVQVNKKEDDEAVYLGVVKAIVALIILGEGFVAHLLMAV